MFKYIPGLKRIGNVEGSEEKREKSKEAKTKTKKEDRKNKQVKNIQKPI